jgi:VanZ family protein
MSLQRTPYLPPMRPMPPMPQSFRHDVALSIYVVLIVYATLYPFIPLRLPTTDQMLTAASWPRFRSWYDITLNVLAYVPLGVFLWLKRRDIDHVFKRIAVVALAGCALSFVLEALQLFVVARVASALDVVVNGAGALIGALLLANPLGKAIANRLANVRDRYLIGGQAAEFGVILILLWFFGQTNPSIPFFEAGNIHAASTQVGPLPFSELNTRYAMETLRVLGVIVSVAGFAFFISSIVRTKRGTMRTVLMMLAAALTIKLAMALAVLKPSMVLEWIDRDTIIGLCAGLIIFFPCRKLSYRWRVYFGILLIAAGALITKISSFYDSAYAVLRLFNWPYGQIDRFASLTRYIHEMWPIATLIFMLFIFFKPPRGWTEDEATKTSQFKRLI